MMIKRGDVVELCYTNASIWQAEVVHTPQGNGDSWQVRRLPTGDMMVVNVHCIMFIGMTKVRSAVSCEHCSDGSLVWNEDKGARVCWICGKVADEPSS